MQLPSFRKLLADARGVAIVSLFTNAVLAVAVAVMAVWIATRTDRVVLVPPFMKSKAIVEWTNADISYRKDWAVYTAVLIGNVTPGNAKFVSDQLEVLLDPPIYGRVKQTVLSVANDTTVRNANGVSYFAPQEATAEIETGKIFVPGYLTIASAGRQPTPQPITYEFIIRMENGLPRIVHLDSYEGMVPHTLKWLEINRPANKPNDASNGASQ